MTWDETFKPFQNRQVSIDADTDQIKIVGLVVQIVDIKVTDQDQKHTMYTLMFPNKGKISILSTNDPYIDSLGRMVIMDSSASHIVISLYNPHAN